jgi:hypothetical protein
VPLPGSKVYGSSLVSVICAGGSAFDHTLRLWYCLRRWPQSLRVTGGCHRQRDRVAGVVSSAQYRGEGRRHCFDLVRCDPSCGLRPNGPMSSRPLQARSLKAGGCRSRLTVRRMALVNACNIRQICSCIIPALEEAKN